MFRSAMFFFVGMFLSVASAFAAQEVPNQSLQHSLDTLKAHSTAAQYAIFANAIGTSPSLTSQLNDLAAKGLLTEFRIDEPTAPPGRGKRFRQGSMGPYGSSRRRLCSNRQRFASTMLCNQVMSCRTTWFLRLDTSLSRPVPQPPCWRQSNRCKVSFVPVGRRGRAAFPA